MLTKTEIAQRLLVSIATVDSWIETGELVATDVRRRGSARPRWRIAEEDLDSFLRSRRNGKLKEVSYEEAESFFDGVS